MNNVIFIAGPEIIEDGQEQSVERFKSSISSNENVQNCFTVGNGHDKIDISQVGEALELARKEQQKVTIIINMHGTMKDGQFYFINGNEWISSKKLFAMIGSKFKGQAVDVVVATCNAAGSIKDKNLLPRGSVIRSCNISRKSCSDARN
jgi:hypothetical protein